MRVAAAMTALFMAFAATIQATPPPMACNLPCAKGETCKLQVVQCVAAPCNPVPTCVPLDSAPKCTKRCPKTEQCHVDSLSNEQLCLSPCANVRCASGTTCVAETVQCIRAPCPSIATCKPIEKGIKSYSPVLRAL